MSLPATARRVERVRHELVRRELVVTAVERPTPGFVRVTFTGDTLDTFTSLGFDDHIKFFASDDARRDYTPRSYDRDRRELVIEFALHGHGAASDWARDAAPGQRIQVGGPRGSMIVPLDYDWHLLVGDATALPAIHRRLEELPAGTKAIAVIHVDDADRREVATKADVTVHWVSSGPALIDATRALTLPPGDGYAWAAGEGHDMAALRAVLVNEKGLPKEALKVAAYWKHGAPGFHGTLED